MKSPGSAPSESQREVLELLKRQGMMTLDEIVESLRSSKTAARAHVVALCDLGLLERVEAPTGRAGRPPLTVRLTDAGHELFPSRDGALLRDLLGFLEREGRVDVIERFFADVWAARRARFDELVGDSADMNARLQALGVVLLEGDFMPAIELTEDERGPRIVIQECHCPLRSAIRATRLPCRFESDFLAYAVAGRVSSSDISPWERGRCRFELTRDE